MSTNVITAYFLVPKAITLEDMILLQGIYYSVANTTMVQGIVTDYSSIPDKRHTEIYVFTPFNESMTLNSRHWHLLYQPTTIKAPSKMHFFLRFHADPLLNAGAMFEPVNTLHYSFPEGVLKMIRAFQLQLPAGEVVSVFHQAVPAFMRGNEKVINKLFNYPDFIQLMIDLKSSSQLCG